MTTNMSAAAEMADDELVAQSLGGNRDAFGRIVSRYQSLICSLAYSATGSLGTSEDLAQETFITAWKHLSHLRERNKLRAWLCGIARNRINNSLRRDGREPVRGAEPLDDSHDSPAPEPQPRDQTISNEEQAILWRSLERIPEIYREPLVLFYREHQSIEAVAEKLELTEDTVKQRLSRGRKLLQEQVLAFVEGALEKTNPGKVFTLGVLAVLPAMTISAKAATLGAAAVKGSATAKAAGVMGLFGAILSPLVVIFGNYASYRMNMDEAQTDQERFHVKQLYSRTLAWALTISAVLAVPLFFSCRNFPPLMFWALLFAMTIPVYFLTICFFAFTTLPARRRYLAQILEKDYAGNFPPAAYEFRSRASLFGLPLVHVRIGDRFDVVRGPVKAWIAIGGSHVFGVIFASGGIAIAPICFGGIGIGILPFSAIALGVFPIGAIAVGAWAYGGLAIGWQIFCGCGVAWNAATGGIVAARDFADGGIVLAAQSSTEAAEKFISTNLFFRVATVVARHGLLLMIACMIPVTLQSWVVARARRRRELAGS